MGFDIIIFGDLRGSVGHCSYVPLLSLCFVIANFQLLLYREGFREDFQDTETLIVSPRELKIGEYSFYIYRWPLRFTVLIRTTVCKDRQKMCMHDHYFLL